MDADEKDVCPGDIMEEEQRPTVTSQENITVVEKFDGSVKLRLLDAALWHSFHQEGTEMIITKAGRRMFPFVMVTLEGLSPTLLYSVHLQVVPCDNRQYKFCQRRWVSVTDAPTGPAPIPGTTYLHPASPNRGSFWCQEMVSFAKLKITNNKHSQGNIVLQSMRKYMVQIIVREDLSDVQYVFPLPETVFVAVTQYQNENITRMKITHNPFANGFKYAHVTGNEDANTNGPRSDVTKSKDTKHKSSSASGTKSSTKTARAKATVTPQTLSSTALVSPVLDTPAVKLEDCTPDTRLSSPPPYDSTQIEQTENSEDRDSTPSMTTTAQFRFQHSDRYSEERKSPASWSRSQGRKVKNEDDDDTCDVEDRELKMQTDPHKTSSKSPSSVSKAGDEESTQHLENNNGKTIAGDMFTHLDQSSTVSPPLSLAGETERDVFKPPAMRKANPRKRSTNKRSPGLPASTTSDMEWCKSPVSSCNLDLPDDCVVKFDHGVQLLLHDCGLWKSFQARGQELSIGKDGRHMFPVITISLRGLDPARMYSVWLNLTTADDIFSNIQSGTLNSVFALHRTPTTVQPYMHPFSPMPGLAWMKDRIAFSEVRVTLDSTLDDSSSLKLLRNRRYQPQILVREEEEVAVGGFGSSGDLLFFPLSETTFIAASQAPSPQPEVRKAKKRVSTLTSTTVKKECPERLPDPVTYPLQFAAPDLRTLPWNPAFMSRTPEPTHRLNNLLCMPAMPQLHPAHLGLPTNRLPPSSPVQPMTSYPLQSLLHQFRSPLHAAYGLALPAINPLPFLYYPYSMSSLSSLSPTESPKVLDLSSQTGQGNR
ncbi:uncharacterized protein LOC112564976 isoform X1 [Pomacea canaliculata]|uniref:uncharacterized protein LOC112564976 isoform X1 n=2 Tax=Pomacea canaliculata TaxID=400727 RepID=UPI000D73E061|nr:uncharacterized protein LOC112564976 isoform X1 [Pomacea canaliculata]